MIDSPRNFFNRIIMPDFFNVAKIVRCLVFQAEHEQADGSLFPFFPELKLYT